MKKFSSLVLCVILCTGIWSVSITAAVEGDFGYELAVGGVGIVNYYDDCEIVAVPDTIAGQPVRVIGGFKRKSLKEVIIPDTAWEIGAFAFRDCDNLESVTIPESVTTIRYDAFASCDNLKDVKLNEGLVKIEESAFYSCDSLTELYIPKTVQSVGKDGDFRSAFSDNELKHLKITVDSDNEYYMSDENGWVYTKDGTTLLMACNAGKTVVIPEGVTKIKDKVFYNCKEIHTLVLPTTLEKIGNSAFAMCTNIKKMELPDSLRYIDELAFSGCWWLTDLTFGTKVEYIASGAFMWCDNLKMVTFLNPDTEIAKFNETTDMSSARRTVTTKYDAFHLSGVETVKCYMGSTVNEYFKSENIITIIKIEIDGNIVKIDSIPYIKNDCTMVPMRAIFEALGAEVSWDNETKTAIGVKDGTRVKITIGENVLYKNGEAITLDAGAEIKNDRTMVPVRVISEAFGAEVKWDNDKKAVEIISSEVVENRIFYTYDEKGNMIRKTQGDSVYDYEYDENGTLLSYTVGGAGFWYEYLYDDQGRVIRKLERSNMKNHNCIYEYTYNIAGEVATVGMYHANVLYDMHKHTLEDDFEFEIIASYVYNYEGKCIYAYADNDARKMIDYIYDEEGKLTSTKSYSGTVTKYYYDESGQLMYEETYKAK